MLSCFSIGQPIWSLWLNHLITTSFFCLVLMYCIKLRDSSSSDLSSSPPGPYQQDAYVIRSEDKLKHPPFLPPHLLQVLLNKDTGISVSNGRHVGSTCGPLTTAWNFTIKFTLDRPQCDPTLLPEPNHVMLNHLYALSIKVSRHPTLLLWNYYTRIIVGRFHSFYFYFESDISFSLLCSKWA